MAFAFVDVAGVISSASRKNNPALCAIGGRSMLDLTWELRQTWIDLVALLRMSRLRRPRMVLLRGEECCRSGALTATHELELIRAARA
jgi:hypothetical protein